MVSDKKRKTPQPKIFTQESVETPKHDDMLIIFSKDSDLLKKVISETLKKTKRKFEIYVGKKTSYRQNVIFEDTGEKKFYFIKDKSEVDTLMPYTNWEQHTYLDKENKKAMKKAIEKGYAKEVKVELKEVDYVIRPEFEIKGWEPEKAIVNNKYYIGSIDLYVEISGDITYDLLFDKFEWKNFDRFPCGLYPFVLEFKPTIKSFSETIRQVKVYEQYFSGARSVVITYSDISKFRECFESQGISLIQLDKDYKQIKEVRPNENI